MKFNYRVDSFVSVKNGWETVKFCEDINGVIEAIADECISQKPLGIKIIDLSTNEVVKECYKK